MLCNKIHCCVEINCLIHFSSTVCLLGVLDYPGKDTVVDVCVWIPTVSGTHPVGSGRGPSVAWAHTSHSPDVVTALDT